MSAASGDFLSMLDDANSKIAELGQTSKVAAKESESAFKQIGDYAHSQIGTIAAGAFDIYADAMAKAIHTHELSGKAIGTALKKLLADTLKSIGEEAAIKGAFEIAEAVAALAGVATAPLAPGHFAAAAEYFSVAAAAGVAAGALGSSGSAASASPSGSADSSDDGGPDIVQHVTIVGTLDSRDAAALHDQLETAKKNQDLAGG